MTAFALSAQRGDTIRLLVTCTRAGSAVSLSGATIYATFKVAVSDADNASTTIQKSTSSGITVTDAAGGLCVVTLDPADTSSLTSEISYYVDVQVTEASGVKTTVATGRLAVLFDVTRA